MDVIHFSQFFMPYIVECSALSQINELTAIPSNRGSFVSKSGIRKIRIMFYHIELIQCCQN